MRITGCESALRWRSEAWRLTAWARSSSSSMSGPPSARPSPASRLVGSRTRGGLEPERAPHLGLHVEQNLGVLLEIALGVLSALPDALARVGVPGAGLLDDVLLRGGVEHGAFLGDALAVDDVELRLAERRRQLVLHHLHLGVHADGLGAVLDRVLPADVEPDGGVELERAATRRGLGRVVDDNAIGEIRMVSFDFKIVPVRATPRRAHTTLHYRDGHGTRKQRRRGYCCSRRRPRLPGEPTSLTGVDLVIHGRMDIRGDQRVESCCLLSIEPKPAGRRPAAARCQAAQCSRDGARTHRSAPCCSALLCLCPHRA